MTAKSKNPKIAIKNPDMRQYIAGQVTVPQMTDSGAGIAAGRIAEITSGTIKLGTEQNTAVAGIIRNAVAAGLKQDVEFGFVPAMMGSPVNVGDRIAPRASGYVGKAQAAQVSLLDATAGDQFTNQPANDGIEIVSSSTADTTQTITLYGVLNGALTTLVTETLTLTGTTQLDSAHTDWYYLLGARLSAPCAGTITIREASGNATITAGLTTGVLTVGIHAATSTQAYGLVPRHDQSAAGTMPINVVGTGLNGAALSVVAALNGTTEEDHGTTPFATVTEVMLGAVLSSSTVNLLTNEATDASAYCGIALQTTAVAGIPVDCWIKPYWM
jgi:hypothetical protein